MDYRVESMASIRLIGKAERQFINHVQADIFWGTCKQDGTLAALTKYSTSAGKEYIGIADSFSYDGKSYLYYIATPYDGKQVPANLTLICLPASLWIKFRCVDLEAESTAQKDIWEIIYSEFFPESEYEPSGYQLEVYPYGEGSYADNISEIWISARFKAKQG